MSKYHISPKTGQPNKCYADKKPCPIGGSEDHYPTKEAARAAYEAAMEGKEVGVSHKKPSRAEHYLAMRDEAQMAIARLKQELAEIDRTFKPLSLERQRLDSDLKAVRALWAQARSPKLKAQARSQAKAVHDEFLAVDKQFQKSYEERSRREAALTKELKKRTAAERVIHNEGLGQVSQPLLDQVQKTTLRATEHNSGATIYKILETADGAIDVKLSSWPRAMEARKELEKKGMLVSMGANNDGQWIRVRPMPTDVTPVASLSWDGTTGQFVGEASELRNRLPQFVKSQKGGGVAELMEPQATYDDEGDILYWDLKPYDSSHQWSLRIFND